MLVFETTEVDPLDRQFAMYEVTMDGSDTYVQDVQLQSCQVPNVVGLWHPISTIDGSTTFVNSADNDMVTYIARINEVVSTYTNFNDDYTWTYAGATMQHRESANGVDVFSDRLSVDLVEFDWAEDDVFSTDSTHTYTAISTGVDESTELEVRVTNQKGQVVNDILKIQVRYNTPVADVTWTPDSPSVADTFVITGANSDVDTRVTNIEYLFDSATIANNAVLDHSWTQSLGSTYQPTHTVSSNITWNDGFTDNSIPHTEVVSMTNIGPTFTLVQVVVGDASDNDVQFVPTDLVDPHGDDTLLELKWKIEYQTPFDGTYKTVYDPGYPTTKDTSMKEWIFNVSGTYKITATAKDEFGLETAVSSEVVFATGSNCDGTGRIKLNNNAWQLISIPVKGKNIKEYFLDNIEAQIQAIDSTKTVADVVERCSAYPGHIDDFLTFVPGVTNPLGENNFPLVIDDGTNIHEVSGFWVRVLDYYIITGGTDIVFEWDMAD
jgi:hypothetical protein